MGSSRFFIIGIFFVAIVLFLLDLPQGLKLPSFKIPYTDRSFVFNPSDINISAGPIQIQKNLEYRLGLDLQGGTQLTYRVDMSEIPENEQDAAFEAARGVIDRRINFFGVTEPTIQTLKLADDYHIIIELPGLENEAQAIDLIGRTAQLEFWEGGEALGEDDASSAAAMYPNGLPFFLQAEPVKTNLTGKDLERAQVVFGTQDGTPQVQLQFTGNGASKFADITKRNVGKPVAIVLDDQVIQAPIVQQAIVGGDAVISGGFTSDQARNLAIQLNAGALPAPLELIGQRSINATLGANALTDSLKGAAIGLFAVIAFMIFIYKREGFLASIALLIYTIIVLFIFKLVPVTLTLAGIAGFILSIGMAVDANILIFERMKEELRSGKSRQRSMQLGFQRAWSSIRDSNVSSLITAAILFYFGSGMIRGFALALAIGIVVSMFTAITITRRLLAFYEKDR